MNVLMISKGWDNTKFSYERENIDAINMRKSNERIIINIIYLSIIKYNFAIYNNLVKIK